MLEIYTEYIYYLVSGFTMFFLGTIWRASNWTNAFIKCVLILLGVWGGLLFFVNTQINI